MTDNAPTPRPWRRNLVLGVQIGLGSLLAGVLVWFLASLVLSRYVAGSLAIAVVYGTQSVLQGMLAHRQSFRYALIPALVIVPLLWWLGWLMMSYNERHQ